MRPPKIRFASNYSMQPQKFAIKFNGTLEEAEKLLGKLHKLLPKDPRTK